jgi:hypothetical protein
MSKNQVPDLSSLPPEEMLDYMMRDLRAFIGVIGSWADILSMEIYQELRPQAIESLQICAKNMQFTYDAIREYLEQHQTELKEGASEKK